VITGTKPAVCPDGSLRFYLKIRYEVAAAQASAGVLLADDRLVSAHIALHFPFLLWQIRDV
jgi:hypothetical protein